MRLKKCVNCLQKKKCPYKKGKKHFCSKECKINYYENDVSILLKEIQKEFNKMITENQVCAVCGKRFEKMQCSHIWSIGSAQSIRFDILNVLPMCGHCHNFWWHLEPMQSHDWFVARYPERATYLEFARHQNKAWTAEELHAIRRAIREKDFQSLIRFKKEWLDYKES